MPESTREELLNQAIDAIIAGSAPVSFGPELAPLVRIIGWLRYMPARDFQSRLKADLQRRALMISTAEPVRTGVTAMAPCVAVMDSARLIDFLKRTFGAEQPVPTPDFPHAAIRIGDSVLMIEAEESVRRGGERIGAFHVYVPDCDDAFQRALDAGAVSMGEPSDRPYGERSGFVKDFAGNHWYIATRLPHVAAPEDVGTLLPFVFPSSAHAFIDFLKWAFAAEEMGVFEESGRVYHAAVRIGHGVLEMGETNEEVPTSSKFFLPVADCDLSYARAVAAGATSIDEPQDQAYGLRTAMVTDPFGYEWVIAGLK